MDSFLPGRVLRPNRAKSHLQDTFIQWCAGMRIPPVRIFDGKYKEFRAEGEELSKERKEFRPASGERKEFKPGERREFRPRFSGERREFGSERREFNGERRPREFKDGEKRESVRVKEESSGMGKDGSSDRGKDVNSVENAEQGRVSLTRKAKEERRERRKKNNTNNDKENECKENK